MKHIEVTQLEYPCTIFPQLLIEETSKGSLRIRGHDAKRMCSAVLGVLGDTSFVGANPGMLTQFLLYDYKKSIIEVLERSVHLDGRSRIYGHWELGFSMKPEDKFPVVMHARREEGRSGYA